MLARVSAQRIEPSSEVLVDCCIEKGDPSGGRAPALLGVTVIDLDRTITVRGTYSPFLLFAARRHAPWRMVLVPLVLIAMLGYRLRLFSRKRLKETMQYLMLGKSISAPTLQSLTADYADHVLRHNLYTDALDLVIREKTEGRLVILATAAHKFYAEPIAHRLGIQQVVATESCREGDSISCRIAGPNCYGPVKAEAVAAKLVALGVERSMTTVRCYSDDFSDLPIFLASDERIAVNPSTRLFRHARAARWPVMVLSDQRGRRAFSPCAYTASL